MVLFSRQPYGVAGRLPIVFVHHHCGVPGHQSVNQVTPKTRIQKIDLLIKNNLLHR